MMAPSKTFSVSFLDGATGLFLFVAMAAATILMFAGCGSGEAHGGPVDPKIAQESLRIVLDAWKNGEKPDQLQSPPRKITAQDLDWLKGMKLVEYKVLDDATPKGTNLWVSVDLTLADTSSKTVHKKVRYIVGTDPAVTVFRELFR
jgi:hypothetical protein